MPDYCSCFVNSNVTYQNSNYIVVGRYNQKPSIDLFFLECFASFFIKCHKLKESCKIGTKELNNKMRVKNFIWCSIKGEIPSHCNS